jgi:hypothetical protein
MMLAKNLMDKLDEDPALAWAKTGAVQGTTEMEEDLGRKLTKRFPKDRKGAVLKCAQVRESREAAQGSSRDTGVNLTLISQAEWEKQQKEPAVLPFVKPASISDLAARLAKIRMGRQLLAAK